MLKCNLSSDVAGMTEGRHHFKYCPFLCPLDSLQNDKRKTVKLAVTSHCC